MGGWRNDILSSSILRMLEFLLDSIRRMQAELRAHLHKSLKGADPRALASVASEEASDTIYAIDRDCDHILIDSFERIAKEIPILLIAEGLGDDKPFALPKGTPPEKCLYRVIVDPIDGTRMLMYDKRSAWTLAGVAPNHGEATSLADIELAVMTELPTSKQGLADTLWATRGGGAHGWRVHLLDGSRRAWHPTPSRAVSLDHGFAQVTKFFLGRKALAAKIEESLFDRMGAFEKKDRCLVFDDQYLSTGGQLYELLAGHDRFQADLRAALRRFVDPESPPPGMACHPYDLCTELIAREAGIVVTGLHGEPVNCPLDTTSDVDWIAYANRSLHKIMSPILREVLQENGLW
jgi:fructose-1,6-bisphosphatase/inositol monophosphatase family enzyme